MNSAIRPEPGDGPPVPHPEVQTFLDGLGSAPDWWSTDIETVRAEARAQVLAVAGEPAAVASVEPVDADGVPGRLYRPAGDETDVLVWAHGGGWMHGDLDTADGVCRALARRAACAVVSVDYRLLPEHPFPAGFEDLWTAVGWARRRFGAVAVGGDSSGGNLAAAAALKARDLDVGLAAQLLVYPVLDSVASTRFKVAFRRRYEHFAGRTGFGADSYRRLQYIWELYAPDPADRTSPYVAPLHAESVDGLAPAVVVVAEHDFLRGEIEDYVARLRAAAVPIEVHEYPGQIHGFFEMLSVLTDAPRAVDAAGDALRRAFRTNDRITSAKEPSCDR